MANYETLKAAIQQVIKTNGNEEITGAILQQTLLAMIASLGDSYQFVGVAKEDTNPGTPDQNVAYLADAGTYPNFNALTIPAGMLGVFKYNGTWTLELIYSGSQPRVTREILYQKYTPSASASKQEYLPLTLYAGHKYHFRIATNGYAIHSSSTYSFTVRVYDTLASDSPFEDILFMTRAQYTGQDFIEFNYNAVKTTKRIRFYVGRAATVGTGIEYTITESVVDDQFVKGDILAGKQNALLPFVLEEGSVLASGLKEGVISTRRVRTRDLVKVYGKTRITIDSDKQFYVHRYTSDDWSTRVGGFDYAKELSFDWDGYISVIVKNDTNTDFTPYDITDLRIETVPVLTQVNESVATLKSVTDYGAVGDGVADDAPAIAAALADGGIVNFPAGIYLVKSIIPIFSSDTKLVFAPGATILRGANIKGLFYTDFAENTTGYNGVKNLTINGGVFDMGTGYSQGGFPIGLIHAENVTIENAHFKRANAGYHSIDACGVRNLKIKNCIISDVLTTSKWGECIQIDSAGSYEHFPIKFNGNYACWDNTPCENVEITGCRFNLNNYSPAVGNHGDGLHKYIDIHDNIIIGTGSSSNDRGAIAFSEYSTMLNNTDIVNVHDNIISSMAVGFQVDTNGLFVVKNNVLKNVGLLKTSASRGTFENNIVN